MLLYLQNLKFFLYICTPCIIPSFNKLVTSSKLFCGSSVDGSNDSFNRSVHCILTIFIVRRMQEEYQKKDKKLYMCFVDMEKAFDRVGHEKEESIRRNSSGSYEPV